MILLSKIGALLSSNASLREQPQRSRFLGLFLLELRSDLAARCVRAPSLRVLPLLLLIYIYILEGRRILSLLRPEWCGVHIISKNNFRTVVSHPHHRRGEIRHNAWRYGVSMPSSWKFFWESHCCNVVRGHPTQSLLPCWRESPNLVDYEKESEGWPKKVRQRDLLKLNSDAAGLSFDGLYARGLPLDLPSFRFFLQHFQILKSMG